MKLTYKRVGSLLLSMAVALSLIIPVSAAGIKYMPGVTAEMADASYWAALQEGAQEVILTTEEIEAFNEDTYLASGTMVMDLKTVNRSFDGCARNEAVRSSATADAEYYFGWTYGPDGEKADWSYYEQMINNAIDPKAEQGMPLRYAIVVERTTLRVFPSENPIWDDPKDPDFDYQHLSSVQVNDPLVIFTTSRDGKFYLARSRDCSGWIPAEDVALCADREEWLSAWDLPSEQLLVVYGNKEYTDQSYFAPETARRMLGQGTRLELVNEELEADELVINRSPYHNYVVYLPVRREDGSYEKQMALLPETAKVSVGYPPLTMENIAMVMLNNLGDAYGWGGMMGVEDCSGLVRTVYSCFGLEIGRNGNWQWNMNMEKIDMANMSLEEKCAILDELPLGAALCFPGHEMMYLGKVDGQYYVISTASKIMSPDTGKTLRTRGVMINSLDVKRANGQTWLQAINQASMPCYGKLEGKSYDFPEVQWYRDGVGYALKNGLLYNDADGYFRPDGEASRDVAVNALWRFDGRPKAAATEKFTDISESAYVNAIYWADEIGIACGYGNGIFGPEDTITCEQMVTLLWRYAKHKGYDVSVGENTNILSYDDAFDISKYAIPAMQWACGSGLLIGETSENGGMRLNAKGETTRAQLSVMLMRFDAWMKQAEYAPHIFDLSQGDLIFSAGAEEYSAYLAADPTPEKPLPPAYASQDGGASWTKLKGEIIVVTSEATENIIVLDFDTLYGEIALTLDGVNTTGDMMFPNQGDATIIIKGNVTTGTIVSGLNYGVYIYGAEGEQTNTLTVNSPSGFGLVTSGDIYVENLVLNVNAGMNGIYTEWGDIALEQVSGTITAGEGFAALESKNPDAILTVNGSELVGEIGSVFSIEGNTKKG